MNTTASPTSHTGIVIDASQRFAERHMARGAMVSHAQWGQGRVAQALGTRRIVDFRYEVIQTAADFNAEELAQYLEPGDDPQTLELEVVTEHVARRTVEIGELRQIAPARKVVWEEPRVGELVFGD